jgi:hypothetical protein
MAGGQPACVCQQQQQLPGAGSAAGHQMAAVVFVPLMLRPQQLHLQSRSSGAGAAIVLRGA